ncbi:hypothetical protein NIES4074_62200 (plasmid) [Cylindrospermum sp. NIES-4074]|nr:hypothetical protein NIES4074_62200 [Cylindrospermum sp. NIES-4074]
MTELTQNRTKVAVIHELPLRNNKLFSHTLRKSYMSKKPLIFVQKRLEAFLVSAN